MHVDFCCMISITSKLKVSEITKLYFDVFVPVRYRVFPSYDFEKVQ